MDVRHLLVVDTVGNVMLADAIDGVRMPIGEPLTAHQRSWVTTAAWSLTGQWTAWSVDSADPDGIREIRLHDEASDRAIVLVDAVRAFYLFPSPCGRHLSHLSPGPLGLELVVTDVPSGESHIIERGQPLYWSWSPDGNELAVHVDDRVLVTDSAGASTRVITEDAGRFVAPWWLPGGTVVYLRDTRIMACGPDGVEHVLADDSSGRFAVSIDGRGLAYVSEDGRLVVLDMVSRSTTELARGPLAGFFWSPDGSRLAALELIEEDRLRWVVSAPDAIRRLQPFRPSRTWTASVLPFFEQYAQSHTHWSTDGARLVAPAIGIDGTSGAVLHTIDAPDASLAVQWIPDADLAWWA